MTIEKEKVVTINYSLIDENGEIIDSSELSEPFTYVHGMEQTLPGIEDVLNGKETGFKYDGIIPCESAYGKKDDEFLIPVPKEDFENHEEFKVGMHLSIVNNYGEEQEMEIVAIDDKNVTIDANSPYADMDIKFKCEVLEVRDATEEEIKEANELHDHDCDCGCGSH